MKATFITATSRNRGCHAIFLRWSIVIMSHPSYIRVCRDIDREAFESEILPAATPVVLKDLVAGWPIVRAALESDAALAEKLKQYDGGRRPQVAEAAAPAEGRLFYREDMTGFNFSRRESGITDTVDRLTAIGPLRDPPAVFVESMPADDYLPRFAADHPMPLLEARIRPRVWLGNAVKINTHFDLVDNIACVAGGRRRFTLFPPDQVGNLYPAPLDFTPSGAPVSLVELSRADHARFPRFAEALRHAVQAELDPGDALFIPYGWWHHVESLRPLNVLVNYWWNDAPDHGAPHGALMHSILAIRDLPPAQRAVWANLFAELVFADPETALAHLPPERRGILGPPSPDRSRKIREMLAAEFRIDGSRGR
jgi:hypothetical protein